MAPHKRRPKRGRIAWGVGEYGTPTVNQEVGGSMFERRSDTGVYV
jgi:hypothetical protein